MAFLLAGCAGGEIGGRPLVYGHENTTDTVQSQHGIVYKGDDAGGVAPAPAASTPASAPSPAARYPQAARYGDLLFLSGQIALDPQRGTLADANSVEAQTARVMDNISAILAEHGLTLANIVSATVYLKNINHLRTMNGVYASYFKGNLPARTVVEVARLPLGALLEITVVAGR